MGQTRLALALEAQVREKKPRMPSLGEACRRHANHYLKVLRSANEIYLRGDRSVSQALKMFDSDREQIELGHTWVVIHWEKDGAATSLCSEYAGAGAHLLDLRQKPHDRIAWLLPTLSASQRLNNRRKEGISLANLGLAYCDLGQHEQAIAYFHQALAISREMENKDGVCADLGNLGLAYARKGDYEDAIAGSGDILTDGNHGFGSR